MSFKCVSILVIGNVLLHVCQAQENLGFFGEIHDGGYPSFDWLSAELGGFDYSDRFDHSMDTGLVYEPNHKSNVRIVRKSTYFDNSYKPNLVEKQHHAEKDFHPEYDPNLYLYHHTSKGENMKKIDIDILEPELNEVYSNDKESIQDFKGNASNVHYKNIFE